MESSDEQYAARLYQEDVSAATMNSHSGKAVLLVKSVISLAETANEAFPSLKEYEIGTVSYDDAVWFAEQMLGLQKEFGNREVGCPTEVDVGFHYTCKENLPRIRSYGLLTKADRESMKVSSSKQHGSVFGDG
jgi:hypothetical protein